jgi:hypothetical protein
MTSKIKVMLGCLGALLAMGVLGVGVAQAASPIQPQFISNNGETIKSNLTVEDYGARTRLWDKELGTVIRCEKATSEGTIGTKGRGTGKVSYSGECKVFAATENATTKQVEEGEALSACAVTEPIVTESLKTRLVWAKGSSGSKSSPTNLLVLYEPASGTTFVGIVITGSSCVIKGTDKVEGTQLGAALAPKANAESTTLLVLFSVLNASSNVLPECKEWEVQEPGGSLESGTAEIKFDGKPAALEGFDQTERVREGSGSAARRHLVGVHE